MIQTYKRHSRVNDSHFNLLYSLNDKIGKTHAFRIRLSHVLLSGTVIPYKYQCQEESFSEELLRNGIWHRHIYTTKCEVDGWWEAAAQHREISSVLCDHLEGWDGEGGRERDAGGKRYGSICICITDSLCYKAETNTPL